MEPIKPKKQYPEKEPVPPVPLSPPEIVPEPETEPSELPDPEVLPLHEPNRDEPGGPEISPPEDTSSSAFQFR